MTEMKKIHKPNPIDIHVGTRLRLRRTIVGLSQDALAGLVGCTFQQIQKYESGNNRVSMSRMWEIANALEVPIQFFFDGLKGYEGDVKLSNDDLVFLLLIGKMSEGKRSKLLSYLKED